VNRRTEQMCSTMRRAVQEVITRGLQDPRVRGLVTVTQVTMDDDLTRARVRVSVMPERHESSSIHGLRAAAGWIRREVGKRVSLRRMPTLEFELDRRFKRQAAVLDALAQVKRERDEPEEPARLAEGEEEHEAS